MAVRIAFIIVLLLTLLKGSTSADSGSCPNEVVNITATLKPGWKHDIHSPGFPEKYPANSTCTWRVTLPASLPRLMYSIGLMVDSWEIETCTDCSCDYLAYGETERDIQNVYERHCHIYSENLISLKRRTSVESLFFIRSYDRELWLRFRSDHSSQFKGFKGQLRIINANNICNNYINTTSGSIASPKYPSHYPKDQNIVWCLAVPHGFRVKLKFSAFELEDTRNRDKDCVNDFVEIRDGGKDLSGRDGRYGKLLGRFCGNNITTEEIYSESNQMWVLFVSDNNATTVYKGFKANFVSGGNFMISSGFQVVACLLATVMWLLM